jgi:E3 ubiquitin-protein ligase synoviolin
MTRIPRLATYGVLSTLGASAVIGSAIRSKPNFYTAAVTIYQSSGALMVLANFVLFNVICFGVGVKALFFGRLRRVEYEVRLPNCAEGNGSSVGGADA